MFLAERCSLVVGVHAAACIVAHSDCFPLLLEALVCERFPEIRGQFLLYFFGADVLFGKGEVTSGLWFLPFVLVWIVGTAVLGSWALRHLWKGATP